MNIKQTLTAAVILAFGTIATASAASAATTVTVPGTADIWDWNGNTSPSDQQGSPTVSILPTLALASLAGINSVTFTVSGITGNCGGCDGPSYIVSHSDGASNGVPNLTAVLNTLVGAWINPSNSADDQSFEIGAAGTTITVPVPHGATELFLGSMDAYQWNNNEGAFQVTLGVPEPATWAMLLLGFFGIGFMIRSARRKDAAVLA